MTVSWESLANDHILGIAPYEPGKPIEELEREFGLTDVIKLASNENPLPPSERVLKAISEALLHLNRYPDGSAHYLRIALARRHGLTAEHIIMGNGSNELIELLARSFLRPGEEAIIPHPSFVVYPMIVQACGGIRVVVTLKDHRLDLEAMARAITPMTKVVFIANPNNPTATLVTAEEVAAFMARVPDKVLVVFDEAYFEFAQGPDFPDSIQYMKQGRKVAILRTFSKAASLAGLRVGYAMADPDCIALLNRIRAPFNVNSLAQVAALAALEDDSHILECLRMNEAGRHFLCDEFTSMGLKYVPSRANFILLDVARSGSDVFQRLLKEGVIVRPMSSFGMETALRVTIGTPEENRRLIKALKKVLAEGKVGVIRRLAIVGLGVLGGSVAKAARAESLAREIVGIGRNASRLEPALAEGAVDAVTTDLREGLSGADMVVLATPVATLEGQMPAVWKAAEPQALITDVGSTKAAIVRVAEALSAARPLGFVGSHPMAGSNLSGFAISRADLFRGATIILTPTDRTQPHAVKRVTEFWEAAGGRVVTMDPASHDRAVAAISHLPHLVADALVDAVVRMDPQFLDVAARGFKDTTRIADSSPTVWREIFEENRDALAEAVAVFRAALGDLESVLRSGDRVRIEAELERIRKIRADLG